MAATLPAHARRKATRPARRAPSPRPRTLVPKDKTLNIRVDAETHSLIDRAASVVGQNRSDFMLTSARERATEILLNQRLFVLNQSDWAAFVNGLDNPPPPNAKLKALLARVPIWDRP